MRRTIRFLYGVIKYVIFLGASPYDTAFWSMSEMTVGHLVFAIATTGYIFIVMVLEERDLIARFGERYRRYREYVPMIVPALKRGPVQEAVAES